jgi:hypothetical protein
MSSLPLRTLTVACGRTTLGFISQYGPRNFVALAAPSGKELGSFRSQAEAALAIEAAHASQPNEVRP